MAQTEPPPRIRIGCCIASCNGDVWGPRSLHEDFNLLAEVEYMLGTMFGNVEESDLTLYLPSEATFQSARKMTDTFIVMEVDQTVLAGRPSGSQGYNLGQFLQASDSLRMLHRYKDGKRRLFCVLYEAMDACYEATCYLRHLAQLVSISTVHQQQQRAQGGVYSVFGRQMRFNISHSIPLVTTRCMNWRMILEDLLCCASGDDGRPGSDGMQWRCFSGEMDQLAYAEGLLKQDPYSRNIMMSTWNPCDPDAMASPSSQVSIQFYVSTTSNACLSTRHCDHTDRSSSSSVDGRFEAHTDDDLILATDGDGEGEPGEEQGGACTSTPDDDERLLLSCHVYQRSIDVFASLPQCISSCAMLTHILAKRCGMLPHEVIVSTGDMHMHTDHLAKAQLQLRRVPLPSPCFHVSDAVAFKEWHELSLEDFDVCGYYSHPDV